MPHLLRLAEAGFNVWPFDPVGWPRAIEIYPRGLTGKVNKSNHATRLAYLHNTFPELDADALSVAGGSEDAFDAAVSALVMDRHRAEIALLDHATEMPHSIEGAIWRPIQQIQAAPEKPSELQRKAPRVSVQPPTSEELYCVLEVRGRPATFATAHEALWKEAVRSAVVAAWLTPRPDASFSVRVEFRTPVPRTINDRWDLDNLIKPTLDAMEGVFGLRAWKGVAQPNDDLVVHLDARKRTVLAGEEPGATVEVWLMQP